MLVGDRLGYVLTALFSVTTAFVALISPAHQREHGWQIGEYYGILLLSASGMVILAQAASLVTVFLGIETMSIGVYVMCAMRRTSRRSNEAAMKYFIVGAFATGFLMYGMALLYGASGTLSLLNMQAALAKTGNPGLVIAGGVPARRRVRLQGRRGAVPHVGARRVRRCADAGHRVHGGRRSSPPRSPR